MRRSVTFGLVLLFCAAALPATAARYASIVVDEKTGTVLHAESPDARSYPASLTKMMTLYLTFEALKARRITLDTQLKVSAAAAQRPPSKLGLRAGNTIAVRDVVGALVTKSANDAAAVIAEALGGSEDRFARIMTARARQLGMTRTTFQNASGLPDRDQVSTVRDMAMLAIALRRDFPHYYKMFSMKSFRYRGRDHQNHNKLLGRYDGTDGVKTGYVRASGYNIAVSVERDGHRLIGVVFGGQSAAKRDRQMMLLLNRTFRTLAENGRAEADDGKPAITQHRPGTGLASRPVTIARLAPAPGNDAAAEESANEEMWSVQVGAFERFAPAHLAASRASRLAPPLRGARVMVEASAAPKGGRLYRARLAGLTEIRANEACRILKQKKLNCLVVHDDNGVAQGDQ